MSYSAFQNNPIFIDLTQAALSTGWTTDGNIATHDSCVAGNLYLLDFPLTIGQRYTYTYIINYINAGYVTTNFGAHQTTSGLVQETITATATQLYFFANGGCQIENFVIDISYVPLGNYAQNTIAWSERQNKWTSFYTYDPDCAFSMFTKTFPSKNGDVYVQEANTNQRCNFFGVQYPATIEVSTNEQPTRVKTYLSLNYQANQLLLSPSIFTSLGQQSQLFSGNFLYATYNDGTLIYSNEGMYKASLLRDMNIDIYNGPPLKGNWMTVELQTTSPSTPLALYTTEVQYAHSAQGIR